MLKALQNIINWVTVFLMISTYILFLLVKDSHLHPLRQSFYVNLLSASLVALVSYTIFKLYKGITSYRTIEDGIVAVRFTARQARQTALFDINRPYRKAITLLINKKIPKKTPQHLKEKLRRKYAFDVSVDYLLQLTPPELQKCRNDYADKVIESVTECIQKLDHISKEYDFAIGKKTKSRLSLKRLIILEHIEAYTNPRMFMFDDEPNKSDLLDEEHSKDLKDIIKGFCDFIAIDYEAEL